jgi:hypothetical protein
LRVAGPPAHSLPLRGRATVTRGGELGCSNC